MLLMVLELLVLVRKWNGASFPFPSLFNFSLFSSSPNPTQPSIYDLGWPQTLCIVENDLEGLILLPQSPEW